MSLSVGQDVRHGVAFIPPSYNGRDKMPVVFDFHGSNSNPRGQMHRSSWDKVAAKNNFIVFAPQGSLSGDLPKTHAWNVPGVTFREGGLNEVAFIKAAVETVKRDFCVDPTRIYASGYSGGGRMLSAYLCSGADDFAAAGFVNSLRGGLPVENRAGRWAPDPASCKPAKPISIMAFAGVKDEQNPYSGGGKSYWQYGFKAALTRWMELDGCKAAGEPQTNGDVTYSLFDTCRNGARIATYVFANGNHDWPRPSAGSSVIAAASEAAAAGVMKVSSTEVSKAGVVNAGVVNAGSLNAGAVNAGVMNSGVVKAGVVKAGGKTFDGVVDPAARMWDFFRAADGDRVIATAASPTASAKTVSACAGAVGAQAQTVEGMTCNTGTPQEPRRSGLGAKGAL
ncbi:PHB depolymerase family esterase [Rhizobium sp. SSA_523]|uniref:alpha/beta hydrolase family esterase n=1 Tax=Rhizobium sp. SSA_523 TaxID=2952477 RepID=UPI00209044B2|nr:PHB depolymerase family esterase [Rhizobium sp. SSA_523]MCO5732095.1 polyhydroxybutyrate depolymerase [Rhizobium sp. SSA_523]WKC25657.1 PHB depolymerase family esterase [Rhizobium sp. SSA_523]